MVGVSASSIMAAVTRVDYVALTGRAECLNGKVLSFLHLRVQIRHVDNWHALLAVNRVSFDAVAIQVANAFDCKGKIESSDSAFS